jgi:hypothetical protein
VTRWHPYSSSSSQSRDINDSGFEVIFMNEKSANR